MSKNQIIVAAIELDKTADEVWKLADTFLRSTDVEVHFVHVVRGSEGAIRSNPEDASKLLSDAHTNLQAWLGTKVTAEDPRIPRMSITVALGRTAEALVQVAVDLEADLLLLGTHGRKGVERLVLGSVAGQVFRMAPCSVLVARPKDYGGLEKSPVIAPPKPGQQHHHVHGHTYHYHRAIPFSSYNSSIYPTGISRGDVR